MAKQRTLFDSPETKAADQGCRIQTSYFGQLKKLRDAGVIPISIARGTPPWFGPGNRELRLAPTREALRKGTHEEYNALFFPQLYAMDPQQIVDEILENAPENSTIALLCWEKPGELCHRRYVAEWIETHCGIVVPEWGFAREDTETVLDWYD